MFFEKIYPSLHFWYIILLASHMFIHPFRKRCQIYDRWIIIFFLHNGCFYRGRHTKLVCSVQWWKISMEILMGNFPVLDVFRVGTAIQITESTTSGNNSLIFLWRHLLGCVSRRIDINHQFTVVNCRGIECGKCINWTWRAQLLVRVPGKGWCPTSSESNHAITRRAKYGLNLCNMMKT